MLTFYSIKTLNVLVFYFNRLILLNSFKFIVDQSISFIICITLSYILNTIIHKHLNNICAT